MGQIKLETLSNMFKWKHYEAEITLLTVRWYLKLGEITELYVEEVSRRKVIAPSRLSCLEELSISGVKKVKVLTGLRNESEIKTYKHCGYNKKDEALFVG